MKALLLAAGKGTRISRYLGGNPKCTVNIGDEILIRYTVSLLKKKGINDIGIVVGYQDDVIKKVLSDEKAITRIKNNKVNSLYFDLKIALKDNQNGQTPFTPAVSILLQLHERLKDILEEGIEVERAKIKELKLDFINRIKNLPLKIFSKNASNAMTAIETKNVSAYSVFLILKDEYNIWVCPNGGELKEKIFRVGHIGQLSISDNDKLIEALNDINKRGLL